MPYSHSIPKTEQPKTMKIATKKLPNRKHPNYTMNSTELCTKPLKLALDSVKIHQSQSRQHCNTRNNKKSAKTVKLEPIKPELSTNSP